MSMEAFEATEPRRLRRPRTFEPFPPPPEQLVIPPPIQVGIYGYSSAGLSIMGSAPKTPDELLELMSQQQPGPRGGRGNRKPKKFFQAHLTWYGIPHYAHETVDELEERLWGAMSADPPPQVAESLAGVDAALLQRWLDAATVEQTRVTHELIQQGATANTCDLLAQLIGVYYLTDQFLDNPLAFLRTHFPPAVSPQHTVVLHGVEASNEQYISEWAEGVHRLTVVRVDNAYRGTGRNQGRFPDFVLGKDAGVVRAKAEEMHREIEAAGWTFQSR